MSQDPKSADKSQNSEQEKPTSISKDIVEKAIEVLKPSPVVYDSAKVEVAKKGGPPSAPPWTLEQFFEGDIDLVNELATRFQNMPVMSSIKFRDLGKRKERGVATLSVQDGAANVVIDADSKSRTIQVSFTFGSMLTLRFTMDDLTSHNRDRWLELMQRKDGGLAFLWGPGRWEKDYLICISRKHFTNLYAFSPHNFEAAIRMTPDVTKQLLAWLEDFWRDDSDDSEDAPPLLTW